MVQTKTYNVLLDTMGIPQNSAFTVNTNDLKTVKLAILINQDSDPLDLTGATVRLAVQKPDKKTVLQDVTVVDATAGSCEIVLDTQAYVIPGNYTAEVMVFYGTDTVAVTGNFTYKAARGIMNDDSVESTNEWQSITQAIGNAEAVISSLADVALQRDIKGTTQTVTTNSNGDVTNVQHKDSNNTVIREDVFDYSVTNLIVETRTLIATGATITYKYHTDTLVTEVL